MFSPSVWILFAMYVYRIVKAFDSIVDALIQQENFTNISVVQRDLALKGERVSLLNCAHKIETQLFLISTFVQVERVMFHGRTLSVGITGLKKFNFVIHSCEIFVNFL